MDWCLWLDGIASPWSSLGVDEPPRKRRPSDGEFLGTAPASFTDGRERVLEYVVHAPDANAPRATVRLSPNNGDFFMALDVLEFVFFGFALLCALVALLVVLLGSRRA